MLNIINRLIDRLLDLSIIFSFDRSGFKRHCKSQLPKVDLSKQYGIITGASSGIGLALSKELLNQGMDCLLLGRNLQKLENNYKSDPAIISAHYHAFDMSNLKKVYQFAKNEVNTPIDLLIHNAGDMPLNLIITNDGFEEMFASQVLAPYILTRTLLDFRKFRENSRIIFVSSGGMYLQKLDLRDLTFKKRSYNKYSGYANAKRAQVILSELFSQKYPEYLFSSMHPGWANTPGVQSSMPVFKKLLNKRLRTAEEGADTILFLATNQELYPNGKFWFDRKQAKPTLFNYYQSTKEEKESLWKYCESIYNSIKD